MNYHQGDIILRKIDKISDQAIKIRKNIIAFGEVTGHSHQIKNSEIFLKNEKTFVRVLSAAPMTHDTHPATPPVEAGDYERLRQNEYFPEGNIEVQD